MLLPYFLLCVFGLLVYYCDVTLILLGVLRAAIALGLFAALLLSLCLLFIVPGYLFIDEFVLFG